ncbi:TPA: acyltransferase family protein [Streptococcus suis]
MRIKWFSTIRVLGLVMVLLYHFYIKYFSGGFVGVDLFFTLSGYLTTALIIDQFHADKEFDFKAFLKRRLYRIFPPLGLLILTVTPLALLIRNDFTANIGRQITAALGFMTNIYEILAGGGYENQFTPHLFVHTWTLAIEVQFYIIWGLALWWITRQARSVGQLRGTIFLSSGLLFVLSFFGMFISSFFVTSYSRIYFSTLAHSFPFFMGSLLATIVGIKHTTTGFQKMMQQWDLRKTLLVFSSSLGLEALLLFFLRFDSIFTYLFGFFLSSLATCAMILAARILHEKTASVKEPAAIQFLADISYGIYLFHWPLYIIFNQLISNHLLAVGLTLLVTLLMASLSYYVLEPYIAGRTGKLFGLEIDLVPYTKWLAITFAVLSLLTLGISLFVPKLGDLDHSLMVESLKQADTRMTQTKNFAEKGKASHFDITDGMTIIGDSVTLRASEHLQAALPDAIIDAEKSRNTIQANEILQTNIDNGTLLKNVVVATGANVVTNYQEELKKMVDILPNGYRLILVTPYDGNSATYDDPIAEKHARYIRQLAKDYDFITVADWNAVAKQNPQIWAGTDNIHFGSEPSTINEGGQLFAQTVQEALKEAENGPIKNK